MCAARPTAKSPTAPIPAPVSQLPGVAGSGATATALPEHVITRPELLAGSEWVLGNGLGGFAMGSAAGVNQRRYHALLIGSTKPPVGRVVGLSLIAETLVMQSPDGVAIRKNLTDIRFAGWDGRHGLTPAEFRADGTQVVWRYDVEGVSIEKRLRLFDGRNAAAVTYRVTSNRPCWLELRPLTALRDFHQLTRGRDHAWRFESQVHGETLLARSGDWTVRMRIPGVTPTDRGDWWWNFEYSRDLARGQDGREDLFSPGGFVVECEPGVEEFALTAWMDEGPAEETAAGAKRSRIGAAADAAMKGMRTGTQDDGAEAVRVLCAAADQFVVKRDLPGDRPTRLTSVIAGYPWFSDWGRDTMIALPGLLITTGRFEEAKSTLAAFARLQEDGLAPNCFDDATGKPQFNTADASLWFIHACCAYAEASKDTSAFRDTLLPACVRVIDAYRAGTKFSIRIDPADGLVAAGDERTQLTWMDAARDGVIFTPRAGKPVELSALWISGLRRLAALVEKDAARAKELRGWADAAAASFEAKFWNGARSCLYDCLAGPDWRPVDEVRPNQIYAASLPHSPLSKEKQRAVVACVRDSLLTPMGLRSLSPDHPNYRPRYEGNLFERDRAYHNGTVWPYLIGAYAEAVLRVGEFSADARAESRRALAPLIAELRGPRANPGPVGTLAEIYDAEGVVPEGRRPDGCPAQAWSVAEVLRALVLSHQ